jgi:XTP/dITP diphosphohydrolase
MQRLLLASNNPGKLREIQALLGNLAAQLIRPVEIGLHLEVVEDGSTYAENAAIKGLAFARASGLLTLADDSGLEVEALGGQPGVHSARYAPLPHATDADRRAYLLQNLQGAPRPWKAHFHCTVVVVTPDEKIHYAEGDCPGEIIPNERGHGGFGYDPIFLVPELGRTMAELTMEEKNQLSHRARAVKAAHPILEKLLQNLA